MTHISLAEAREMYPPTSGPTRTRKLSVCVVQWLVSLYGLPQTFEDRGAAADWSDFDEGAPWLT